MILDFFFSSSVERKKNCFASGKKKKKKVLVELPFKNKSIYDVVLSDDAVLDIFLEIVWSF